MTFAKFVFKIIDVLFKPAQNPRKLLKQFRNDNVVCENDIVFAPEYADIKLNIYHIPREDGQKYPVIFEIHGGGFSAGDKKYRNCLCRWFCRETGAFVVNVNYGLGQKYQFPEPVKHLVAAFNWVVANAEKYNLDTDRMLVTGDSAGAYYSAFLSVLQNSQELQDVCGKMNGRFAYAVLNCGIYDVQQALQQKVLFNLTNGVSIDFAGVKSTQFDNYQYKDLVSPVNFVTADFPRTLVIYAGQDFFCGGQHDKLMEKLQACGVAHDSYGSTKFSDNHTFSLTWKTPAAQEANAKIIAFIKEVFATE